MKLFSNKNEAFKIMTYKKESSKNINEITSSIENTCANYKFALLYSYNYQEVLESKGFPIDRKVFVYEICAAKVASLVLTQEPSFAPFMPCRIAVYEENSKTIISTQNLNILIDCLDTNTEIYKQTTELYSNLKSLINELT